MPPQQQQQLAAELKINVAKATPAGAVLIGFSLAQTFGIGETIDYLLSEPPSLKSNRCKMNWLKGAKLRISTGTACEVLIADMLGCYKNLPRLYRIEEAWRVKDILGLPLPDPVAIVEAINTSIDYRQIINRWYRKMVT